ncbi:hypothetical protein J2T08_005415 [Neorhizobium galegae]|nr:hypothetical protein [Neorhizobium galegae]MDQ0137476.1 hypothetical protein [Neorhizobium galegae]
MGSRGHRFSPSAGFTAGFARLFAMRPAGGATASATGTAMMLEGSHAPIQIPKKPSVSPAFRSVETPETSEDIGLEGTRLKMTGIRRAGIMGKPPEIAVRWLSHGQTWRKAHHLHQFNALNAMSY